MAIIKGERLDEPDERDPDSDPAVLAVREEARRQAYVMEADPLFFKWQRGEATEQEWLDKIAEIKLRFES